ncbi:MAG: GLPGLI family protein [Muribaculaceae bacterium]|nr:GLPGLI family protein [Muribaculaceae bacterium]
MKLFILFILMLSVAFMSKAQIGIFSMSQERATVVDTARYKVTYALNYTCHPEAQSRFDDVRTVLIGHHSIKDFSDIICHFDSLMTADIRRGADSYRNPNGSPWPYEVLLSPKEKSVSIKYRLPMGNGVLSYSDRLPVIDWSFIPDTTRNVIGYECQLAECDFAGRHYSAWFTPELPLPYGPYKFGGLPGLILEMQDSEGQFVWTATGFERADTPISVYDYTEEKQCTKEEADKTIARIYKAPNAFLLAAMGGGKGRLMVVGKDGKTRDATDIEETPIPYKPIEMK